MKKSCDQVVTIPQIGPTCWFNALLMIFFYSQGMRRALFSSCGQWNSDNEETMKLYDMFLDVLVSKYVKKKLFKHLSPEQILKSFHKIDPKLFFFNPDTQVGMNFSYTPSMFRFFHLHDQVLYIRMNRTHIDSGPNGEKNLNPKIIGIRTDSDLVDDYTKCTSNNKNKYRFDFKKGTLDFNGVKYIIDSVYVSNIKMGNMGKKLGHSIAGVTCNKKRYIYNGWVKNTNDPGMEWDKFGSTKPCELMEYDWLNDDNTYCINTKMCKMDKVDTKEAGDKLCFNFKKGDRAYYLVREDIYTTKSKCASKKTTPPKNTQQLPCPHEYYKFT